MVLVILCDVEVHRTLALIGIAVGKDLLHELYLLDDVTRCVWLDAWREHVQRIHHLVVMECVLLYHLHRLNLLETSLFCNLVLTLIGIMLKVTHIGDVTHVTYLVAKVLQITEQHVESNCRTCVAKVRWAIDCWAAYIKAHIGRVKRLEQLLLA